MAGLCAAARARELGLDAVVHERGDRPGGSMLLSSCVVWRYLTLEDFRAECPGGDPALQRLVLERLDDGLRWLEGLGAPVVARETGNPRTSGLRFDPRGLTEALVGAAGGAVRLGSPLPAAERPLLLATGGAAARLARERDLALRANPWSDGAGIELALGLGAALHGDPDEFYGRALPAVDVPVEAYVPAAQLYGRWAHVVDDAGRPVFEGEPGWAETDLVQALARQPRGEAWYVVDAAALGRRVRERSVGEMVATAERLGTEVRRAGALAALGLGPLRSPKLAEAPFTAVRVRAAVTHTIAGLRVDEGARVLRPDGTPLEGLLAAGADAGGISTGGYASGLASALVLGLAAAETARAGYFCR